MGKGPGHCRHVLLDFAAQHGQVTTIDLIHTLGWTKQRAAQAIDRALAAGHLEHIPNSNQPKAYRLAQTEENTMTVSPIVRALLLALSERPNGATAAELQQTIKAQGVETHISYINLALKKLAIQSQPPLRWEILPHGTVYFPNEFTPRSDDDMFTIVRSRARPGDDLPRIPSLGDLATALMADLPRYQNQKALTHNARGSMLYRD